VYGDAGLANVSQRCCGPNPFARPHRMRREGVPERLDLTDDVSHENAFSRARSMAERFLDVKLSLSPLSGTRPKCV
jgi:hypothetical protein